MGVNLKDAIKVRGIISYRLSPYELSPFRGLFSGGYRLIRRFMANNFLFIAAPAAIHYSVYEWGQREYARSIRKNPADYANDE